ncbi:AIPR family protein [Bradyrhizobium sp.]|uniref:AIPR family protein n=1 Tax=Bradyrhizobium sp. TaxID=376 RepID=UPI001ED05F8E|nr:AIPR family protein [Bradyrhizobium sp.]MBV9982434.1 AIPR family protein [Bradyrhizobium sp.]
MDLITTNLLAEFSKEFEVEDLAEDDRFELLASYITAKRHYTETFSPSDIVLGNDIQGIDAVGAIINGVLITDPDALEELVAAGADYLEVVFVFVQAKRSPTFEASQMGNFGYSVEQFFIPDSVLSKTPALASAIGVMRGVYSRSSKFKRGNPSLRLYYVTTGRWTGDPILEERRQRVASDLLNTGSFSDVEFTPIGAPEIQRLYQQSKNAISREFQFPNRQDVPEIPGVNEAYVGFVPAKQFLPIICDDAGEIVRSVFYDNVRDFQGYAGDGANDEMRKTLDSERRSRFVLMNNGITIITRNMTHTQSRFHIEDFQIVNGCQTSHVLFDQRKKLDDTVQVPLRLIWTQDEDVIEDIIRATNKQTEIRADQFFALTEFGKQLEAYFQSVPEPQRLYYERRSRQYDRLAIEKTRVVVQTNAVRAFAAMFLQDPHSTVRRYKSLSDRVGNDIFVEGHKPDSYYTAAYANYCLDFLWRNSKMDNKYKVARYQLLLAFRLLANPGPLPKFNSHKIETYCAPIRKLLSDMEKAGDVFGKAVGIIDAVAGSKFDRDNIHTLTFTENVIKRCKELTGE